MLTNATLEKLQALNLTGMARAFAEQLERADYQALSFEQRLGLPVDREAQDRDNRRLERNLKAARLRVNAVIEDLDFGHPRVLDRALLLSLAEAQWVAAHRTVLIVGATGVGKTWIACALAQAALRRGHTALYGRTPRLLGELALARADGRLPRLLAAWARVDVLVLDDLGLQPLTVRVIGAAGRIIRSKPIEIPIPMRTMAAPTSWMMLRRSRSMSAARIVAVTGLSSRKAAVRAALIRRTLARTRI
jgi:DNA replication protein DnaC